MWITEGERLFRFKKYVKKLVIWLLNEGNLLQIDLSKTIFKISNNSPEQLNFSCFIGFVEEVRGMFEVSMNTMIIDLSDPKLSLSKDSFTGQSFTERRE